ncbi:MAG: 2Fe-2S iron-sulfur cluster binding domain-containing protein [Deltaproteobacteria bacterium]|nr:2Fe-2S iron-sulfur cluster binding domain-containing protein [Deltaproteobacteria bacterium]
MKPLEFSLNGERVVAEGVDPTETLLSFLRRRGLTGTKEGCAEGECGACAVVLREDDGEGGSRYVTVNSCLLMLGSVAGRELLSVEGLAREGELHPVQAAMARGGASQCGYCTPGFVMSLFSEYYRADRAAPEPRAIEGNLCRCTGYRPIYDALESLGAPAEDDVFLARLKQEPPKLGSFGIHTHTPEGERAFHRPADLHEVFHELAKHPDAKLVAGGTDVLVEANQSHRRWPAVISLEAVSELREASLDDTGLTLGAAVPLEQIEARFASALPVLGELLPLFASPLIRRRATFGGNLANASPIGDGAPTLLALDAEVVIASSEGERRLPLADFFLGYRQTALSPGEILRSVFVPRPFPDASHFYKVSKRVMDDISTVAACFCLWRGEDGAITRARFGYGGVAATPMRARDAEAALEGHALDPAHVEAAAEALGAAFTPIDDHRGSAEYRGAMVVALFERFVHDLEQAEVAR